MKHIALVAGEASGDLLGASLIQSLKRIYPDARFSGIGGDAMRLAGMDCWHHCDELAVMGLTEVLKDLPRLLGLRRRLTRRLIKERPDCMIGIDAPDFNLGLERQLKQQGIPTVHYVSPSVWAWRPKRAAKIANSCDLLLALLPFEPEFYKPYPVNVSYIGHPLADEYPIIPDTLGTRQALSLDPKRPVVAIMPGSRRSEVKRLSPDFLSAAQRLHGQRPAIQFVLPTANQSLYDQLKDQVRECSMPVRVLLGQSRQAMTASDVIMLASGTAALEGLLCKKPMVVGYRLSAMTHFIVRSFKMMTVNHFSLPNVLADTPLIPELMQHDLTSEGLAAEVLKWLDDAPRRHALELTFDRIHKQLRCDSSTQAAGAISQLLDDR